MEVRQGHKSDSKQKQTVALHQGWKLGFRYILIINERLNHPVSFKDNNRSLFRSHKQAHTEAHTDTHTKRYDSTGLPPNEP